ncbi:MAG TPA: plasmid partition protein ParG [Nostocaceae cyanobacterium]|nr:plasmid partition protein ParG [Nostocaceae cyanobacterium]
MVKRTPEGKAELSIYVSKDVKIRFKVACTQQDRTMGDVVSELIENWLNNVENQKQ